MQIDRGYVSAYMVINAECMEALLENPYLLIADKKISAIADILPVLEKLVQVSWPLVIAVLTGGQAISEEVGLQLENVNINMLGQARRVSATKDNTTIVEGCSCACRACGDIQPATAACTTTGAAEGRSVALARSSSTWPCDAHSPRGLRRVTRRWWRRPSPSCGPTPLTRPTAVGRGDLPGSRAYGSP
jgi:hypothetical protein